MDWKLFLTVYGLIFIAELPDKTAFAALLMAARNNPFAVFRDRGRLRYSKPCRGFIRQSSDSFSGSMDACRSGNSFSDFCLFDVAGNVGVSK